MEDVTNDTFSSEMESEFERHIFAGIYILISITGSVGNSLVIIAVVLSKQVRRKTNVFVVNLAVADVLTCLFTPWQSVAVLGRGEWPIPEALLCVLVVSTLIVTLGCSINTLALIAIDRWVTITKSRLTTRRLYTPRKLALMVIFAWVTPICCALVPVVTDVGVLGFSKEFSICSWDRTNQNTLYFELLIIIIGWPVQSIIIVTSYVSIFRYVRKTSRKTARTYAPSISAEVHGGNRHVKRILRQRQLDVTKNLLYIVLAYIICSLPFFTTLIFYDTQDDRFTLLLRVCGAILLSNSCINPVIYATSHPYFKTSLRHLIRCKHPPT